MGGLVGLCQSPGSWGQFPGSLVSGLAGFGISYAGSACWRGLLPSVLLPLPCPRLAKAAGTDTELPALSHAASHVLWVQVKQDSTVKIATKADE